MAKVLNVSTSTGRFADIRCEVATVSVPVAGPDRTMRRVVLGEGGMAMEWLLTPQQALALSQMLRQSAADLLVMCPWCMADVEAGKAALAHIEECGKKTKGG